MIVDHIKYIEKYKGLTPNLDLAIETILSRNLNVESAGKVVVNNDELFYLVQEYTTRSAMDVDYEAHRRYIDLQLMIEGSERMDYGFVHDLEATTSYDESLDVQFFKGHSSSVVVKSNEFAIFFPTDGHRPGIQVVDSEPAKKVVFKIKL